MRATGWTRAATIPGTVQASAVPQSGIQPPRAPGVCPPAGTRFFSIPPRTDLRGCLSVTLRDGQASGTTADGHDAARRALSRPSWSHRLAYQNIVDAPQLLLRETKITGSRNVLIDLSHLARADDHTGHAAVPQSPGQRHLCQALAARRRQFVQCTHPGERILGDVAFLEEAVRLRRPRITGQTVQVTVGEKSLSQWAEGDAAHALAPKDIQQSLFGPAPKHRILHLVDE